MAEEILILVDPPSPFDALETWEQFLKEIESWPDNVMLKDELARKAKLMIGKKRHQRNNTAFGFGRRLLH